MVDHPLEPKQVDGCHGETRLAQGDSDLGVLATQLKSSLKIRDRRRCIPPVEGRAGILEQHLRIIAGAFLPKPLKHVATG